jgi:hypothetical protein
MGVFALLMLGLLTPTTAKASHCGRILSARLEADLARLVSPETSSDEVSIVSEVPETPIEPCRGTLCQAPPVAPAVPVAPVSVSIDHWLCLIDQLVIPSANAVFLAVDEDDANPLHNSLSIFHPPRSLSLSA